MPDLLSDGVIRAIRVPRADQDQPRTTPATEPEETTEHAEDQPAGDSATTEGE